MPHRANLRSIGHIIGNSTDNLGSLRRFARYLQKIQSVVDVTLPEAAIGSVRVASCENGRLVLLVDSGTWATRIRYQQAIIARGLAQRLRLGIEHLEVRVRPQAHSTPRPITPRQMDANARHLIRDCAGYVHNNPELAAALERLASAGRKPLNQAAATGRALT